MNAVATTTVTIYRGTDEDEYGDPEDNETPLATAIPASIIEQSRIVSRPDSDTPRVVRSITGRVGADTDILDSDRIKDEATDEIYTINAVSRPASPVHTGDIRLDLSRTT